MAHYYNVVTNPNGTFTIENIQQICSIDGQSVQLVVEDIDNGANVITQPILAYTAAPDNTEQTIFSQPTLNLGAHVTSSQLEPRQSVYIIKTNDPPNQQNIYNKADSENTKFQDDNNIKGAKDQLNVSYTQTQSDWLSTRAKNESFELIIKKDSSLGKNFNTNTVKNQQNVATTQAPSSDISQGGSDKKTTRLIPINKRHSTGPTSIGILRTTLTGPSSASKLGKMKRNSNLTSTSNISTTARSRASIGGVGTGPLSTPPRGPQARPPIHSEASQRNSLANAKNAPSGQYPEMGLLSERIKQASLKHKQQNERLQKQQQPVMAVSPVPRPVQPVQGPLQRQRAMGQLLGLNRQQLHLQQQQLLQRQSASTTVPVNRHNQTMTDNAEPMEVDSSDNVVQPERLSQLNCTAKSDPEDNSSESFAYLQQEIDDPHTAIVQQQILGNEAKMLVILANGEQRLITFEVPKEDCTVQDLLEQANICSIEEPRVSLVSDPALGINYIVEVASRETTHDDDHENTRSELNATTHVESKTMAKHNNTSATLQTTMSPRVPKYVKGMLAVCSFCGMSAADFNYCMRCKRKLPENVKAISISSGLPHKKEGTIPVDTFYKKSDSALAQKLEREVVSKRGRGRGRIARARQIKEPECLTISSDEEDDNRKQKRLDENKEISNSLNSTNSEESETILEKEPVITNNSVVPPSAENAENNQYPTSGGKEQSASPDATTNRLGTYLTCRTVRIGSYKYIPNEKIFISSSGLKLQVPLLEDEKSFITLDIKINDLVKVLIHFAKSMPVLFFYTNVTTGLKIRDLLGMQDPKGPYFDPASKDHTHKRITLLPEKILDESKTILKDLYKPIFEELNSKEANDILVKASPKAASQIQTPVKKQSSSSNNVNSNGIIQTITVYPPPPAKGGIAINTEDYICLAEDQFLNDVIIDFYLKYLTLEQLSQTDHNKTHVFSSYFYKRLTSPHTQAAESTENLSAAAKRHARVQKWTKNVNIFEKDFVVIPINEHAHWFLAIICFPGLVGTVTPKTEIKTENKKLPHKKKKDLKVQSLTIGNTTITPVSTITIDTNEDGSERDEAEGDDEEMESDSDDEDEAESKTSTEETENSNSQTSQNKEIIKVPCILIFDSLAGASRSRVVATLRDYLSCEYQAKMGAEKLFSKDTIKGACPKVPQQSNFTDCGLYVLQYVESFFQTPIADYTLPIKTLKNWFEEIVVTRKREEIAQLLTELVNNTKGNKTINLPNLAFPTQGGKLKQKTESQVETRASKAEAEAKKKVVDSGESKVNTTTTSTNSTTTTTATATTTTTTITATTTTTTTTSTTAENTESSSESSSKDGTSQLTIPQSSNQILYTTDTNLIVQKEAVTPTTRSSADTMAFLKNKRIPRLQKSSENQEDKQIAKKHKGDSFDSCK